MSFKIKKKHKTKNKKKISSPLCNSIFYFNIKLLCILLNFFLLYTAQPYRIKLFINKIICDITLHLIRPTF